MKHIFNILFIVFSWSVYGQLDIHIETSESTCENNGKAGITTTGAIENNGETNITYIITNGPMDMGEIYPIILTSPNNIFLALSPGDYTLEVFDNFNEDSDPITMSFMIEGDYQTMEINPILINETCDLSDNGSIEVNVINGYGPFMYSLYFLEDTTLISTSSNNLFNNLDSSNYLIIVEDACSNTRTKIVTLITEVSGGTKLSHSIDYDCEFVYLTVIAEDKELEAISLTYIGDTQYESMEIISPTEHSYVFRRPYTDVYNLFSILNSCGEEEVKFINTSEFSVTDQYFSYNCDSILWDPIKVHILGISPVMGNIIDHPDDYSGPTIVNEEDYIWITPGYYTVLYTDSCGYEQLVEYDLKLPSANITYGFQGSTCSDESSKLQIKGLIYSPNQVNILSAPEGFNFPLNFITENNSLSYDDVPLGYYRFQFINTCGDTLEIDFDLIDPLYESIAYVELIPGCEDQNTLKISYTNNIDDGKYLFKMKNLETNKLAGGFHFENDTIYYELISAGEYFISFRDAKIGDVCDTAFYLTIPEYETPQIFAANIYLCNEDSLSTTAAVVGGISPYQYDLIDNDTDEILIEGQLSPLFDGLEKEKDYRIRVTDACGNSSSQDVNVIPVGIQQDLGGPKCITEGEPFPIIVYEYAATEYSWILPDRTTVTGLDLGEDFMELDSTDSGIYSLIIDFNNGCRIDTIEVELILCALLPVKWLNFSGKQVPEGVQLFWSTSTEENNDYFRIERSDDGRHWYKIGTLPGNGTSYQTHHYTFIDKSPSYGRNYYRVVQVDYDLRSESSNVITIDNNLNHRRIYTSPQNLGVIIVDGATNEKITIFSSLGKALGSYMVDKDYYIIEANHLRSGVYFIVNELGEVDKIFLY